jgi:hypothetical protein
MSWELSAQNDSTGYENPEVTILGFADVFYVYDFNQPLGNERQAFLFNHNRHNEFNLNLGLIRFSLEQKRYRANLALQTGTYANDNYASEQGTLKNVFEANLGISLDKQNSLWLDAGIMPSHLGFESALSMDNMTLTRSLLAENSPYFLTGAKLSYSPNERVEIAGLVVNGWQRIQRLEGNSMLSYGTQVSFKANEKTTLNWSTFIGTDDPDSTRRMRYFNNVYGQFQITDDFQFIAGIDLGTQQKTKNSAGYEIWYCPIIIGQYSISDTWKTAVRAELYHDETGVIIPTGTPNGFQTTGLSLNLDYSPTKNIMCRIEGRWLQSQDEIFKENNTSTKDNVIIGLSMAIKFEETVK